MAQDELEKLQNHSKHPRIVSIVNGANYTKPLGEQRKAVQMQTLMILLISLGLLAAGTGLAIPAVTLHQLTDPNEVFFLDKSQASWFASVSTIACPLGSLLSSYVLDAIGRKRTCMLFNLFAIISWGLMAFAIQEHSKSVYIQLILSRCLIGITMGMASFSGVYGAEISLPKIRGRLMLVTPIAIASGVLLIYILGYFIRDDWHFLAKIMMSYQIVCLLLVIPLKESPSWLLSKGRAEEAKTSLTFFRGLKAGETHKDVELEFSKLELAIQHGTREKKASLLRSLNLPEIYKPLFIMTGLFFCQQFSGIYVIVVYAVQIATKAGVKIDPMLCTVYIGVARVLTTFAAGWVLEKWGRRPAAMASAAGMSLCMFLLAALNWFSWLSIPYLPAALIVLYIVSSALGLWTLPFFIASEVFPQKVRGACIGFVGCFAYIMSFCVLKVYPTMEEYIGCENVFVFYGSIALFTVLFVYIFLPETKDKTLLEIEESFRNSKKESAKERELEVEMKEIFVK